MNLSSYKPQITFNHTFQLPKIESCAYKSSLDQKKPPKYVEN